MRARLIALTGRRLTHDGVLIIEVERSRSQRRNRDDAQERLIELIREACEVDKRVAPPAPRWHPGNAVWTANSGVGKSRNCVL